MLVGASITTRAHQRTLRHPSADRQARVWPRVDAYRERRSQLVAGTIAGDESDGDPITFVDHPWTPACVLPSRRVIGPQFETFHASDLIARRKYPDGMNPSDATVHAVADLQRDG